MARFDRTAIKTMRARQLRRDATKFEQRLWFYLRGAQLDGLNFRRQHPVGPYILDFYCAFVRLAVELDGDQHGLSSGLQQDKAREQFLNKKGIRVLRFWNDEVRENLDGVLETIHRAATPTRPAAPGTLPLSGGGKSNLTSERRA